MFLDYSTGWTRFMVELPINRFQSASRLTGRYARMTVLALEHTADDAYNLFTLVRHRRSDSLGPWANVENESWSRDEIGPSVLLSTIDAPLERCQGFVEQILDRGTLHIEGLEVEYSLEHTPRRHLAHRDSVNVTDVAVRSPFSRHSAEIIEYWSFAVEPCERWLEARKSLPGLTQSVSARIGFPLELRVERVGNLMIAGAQDEITCDLKYLGNKTLRFHVGTHELLPDAYRASVWALHSGDEILRRESSITVESTVIDVGADVDRIGFAVYREADGQCIDLYGAVLIKELNTTLYLDTTPEIALHERGRLIHTVKPSAAGSATEVKIEPDVDSIDKNIRRLWLDSRAREYEEKARAERDLFRFSSAEFEHAVRHFIDLISGVSDHHAPIYIADNFFMRGCEEEAGLKLYLDMFAATTGRPLRILCAAPDNEGIWPWWSSLTSMLRNHVSIRSFRDHDGRGSGFHDRYLITPERETIITNSFNGWAKDGVTFVSHGGEVYRTEAERLWAMDIESESAPLLVRTVV